MLHSEQRCSENLSADFCVERDVMWLARRFPTAISLGFLDRNRYLFFQVALHLNSRGWVDLIPDPLLLRKSGRAGNRTRNLSVCSQEL
jgi:hypothetical protein